MHIVVMTDEDEKRWKERLKKVAKPKQPPPAKSVGDQSPNPLPDTPIDDEEKGGGDPGRSG
ncbi:MAG TPA: hypothetical protein VK474_13595 [Chthoniobacterales bacterium]|nr:hypothetical protein [Chthoniobacterales bacterium]